MERWNCHFFFKKTNIQNVHPKRSKQNFGWLGGQWGPGLKHSPHGQLLVPERLQDKAMGQVHLARGQEEVEVTHSLGVLSIPRLCDPPVGLIIRHSGVNPTDH